MGYRLL